MNRLFPPLRRSNSTHPDKYEGENGDSSCCQAASLVWWQNCVKNEGLELGKGGIFKHSTFYEARSPVGKRVGEFKSVARNLESKSITIIVLFANWPGSRKAE